MVVFYPTLLLQLRHITPSISMKLSHYSSCFLAVLLNYCIIVQASESKSVFTLEKKNVVVELPKSIPLTLPELAQLSQSAKAPDSLHAFRRGNTTLPSGRVYNGVEATPHEFKWMVNLYITRTNGDVYFCGGILIHYQHILTAAQCLYPLAGVRRIDIVAGDHDTSRNEGTEQITTGRYMTHPGNFNPDTLAYDVAVIDTTHILVETAFVKRVPLADPTYPGLSGTQTTFTGWGSINEIGVEQNRLRKTEMNLTSNSACSSAYFPETILSNMVCATGVSGSSGCMGDAGGPLMCHNALEGYFVCGTLSFIAECRTTRYPNGFSRMSHFVEWLRNSVGVSVLTAGYTPPTTTTPRPGGGTGGGSAIVETSCVWILVSNVVLYIFRGNN